MRTFSVEEANLLLPSLRNLTGPLESTYAQLSTIQAQIDAIELITDINETGTGDNVAEMKRLGGIVCTLEDRLREIVIAIQEMGCHVKAVSPTLIDFFTLDKSGDVVYLCWQAGEATIGHWHEVGKGFGDREPLDTLQRRGGDEFNLN